MANLFSNYLGIHAQAMPLREQLLGGVLAHAAGSVGDRRRTTRGGHVDTGRSTVPHARRSNGVSGVGTGRKHCKNPAPCGTTEDLAPSRPTKPQRS